MTGCTNSSPRHSFLAQLIFLFAFLALPAVAQTRSEDGPYRKIALKTTKPCTVAPSGEITTLVKNGVELSVNEDFDCDGVPDAYDNCVGMPNSSQSDSDRNGIGDVCEAAVTIKTAPPAKTRSNTKEKTRKATAPANSRSNTKAKNRKDKADDKPSRPSVGRRRNH